MRDLSKKERLVMDIVFAAGKATVAEVQAELPDTPSYPATRMLLQRLHKRGLLTAEKDGKRHVYAPAEAPEQAAESAFRRLINTFYGGSAATAFTALLGNNAAALSKREVAQLEQLLEEARRNKAGKQEKDHE